MEGAAKKTHATLPIWAIHGLRDVGEVFAARRLGILDACQSQQIRTSELIGQVCANHLPNVHTYWTTFALVRGAHRHI